jgi:hypothetical protein
MLLRTLLRAVLLVLVRHRQQLELTLLSLLSCEHTPSLRLLWMRWLLLLLCLGVEKAITHTKRLLRLRPWAWGLLSLHEIGELCKRIIKIENK